MQVYGLITCVQRANENAGNLISVVQFLINIYLHSVSFLFVRFREPLTPEPDLLEANL